MWAVLAGEPSLCVVSLAELAVRGGLPRAGQQTGWAASMAALVPALTVPLTGSGSLFMLVLVVT